MAYRIAINMALREAAQQGMPSVMEPIMKLEVVVPDEYTGDIISDVNTRRGRIERIDMRDQLKLVDAFVPMSDMFGYATTVRSLSQGRLHTVYSFNGLKCARAGRRSCRKPDYGPYFLINTNFVD
jgi:elongation factor G